MPRDTREDARREPRGARKETEEAAPEDRRSPAERDPELRRIRASLDDLDHEIEELVRRRDGIVRELIRTKGEPPYDPEREHEIARHDEAFWLPVLRRMRTAEGARERPRSRAPGAFPETGFIVVAGPCAVDDHLEESLVAVARSGVRWCRAGAFKPRTFPWSYQGSGLPGLRRLREVADRLGMRVVSEVLSEHDAEAAAELVDVVQVGARNCQNYALLRMLSRLGRPVLLKRGPSCTVEEWLGAAAYLEGRVPVTLCERGVRSFDPCFRNTIDLAGAVLARRLSGYQTIVDPSHGTGLVGLIPPMVLAARAAGLDGAMIEVHASPSDSASDGHQALDAAELRALVAALAAS